MNKKAMLIVALILLGIIAVTMPVYQDWKAKPENRDPFHAEGIIYDNDKLPVEGFNISVKDDSGKIFVTTKTDADGEFSFDIPACVLGEPQYQTLSTEPINQGPVVSISQAVVYDVWMCGNPWGISIKMEKDGYSSINEMTSIGKEGKLYTVHVSKSGEGDSTFSEINSHAEESAPKLLEKEFSMKEFLKAHNFEQWNETEKKDLVQMVAVIAAGDLPDPENKSIRTLETLNDYLEVRGLGYSVIIWR